MVPYHLVGDDRIPAAIIVDDYVMGGLVEVVVDLAGIVGGDDGLSPAEVVEGDDGDAFGTVQIRGVGTFVSVQHGRIHDKGGLAGVADGDGDVFGGLVGILALKLQQLGIRAFGVACSKKHHNERCRYDAFVQIFTFRRHPCGLSHSRVLLDPAAHVHGVAALQTAFEQFVLAGVSQFGAVVVGVVGARGVNGCGFGVFVGASVSLGVAVVFG